MREWVKVLVGSLALMIGASAPSLMAEFVLQPCHKCRPELYRSTEQKPNAPADTERIHESGKPPVAVVPQIAAPDDREVRKNQDNGREKEGTEFFALSGYKFKITDFFIALFTGLLVCVGAVQARRLRRTIEAMRDAERRQTRAYVGVSEIRFDLPHLSWLAWRIPDPLPSSGYVFEDHVLVIVKNFGESPAYEVRVQVNWQLIGSFGMHPSTDFIFPHHAGPVSASASQVLDKGNTFTSTINAADMWDFQMAEAKLSNLYVYGRIFYTDVYGRRWRREYCYVYEPWRREGERFVSYTGSNDETYEGPRQPKLPA